MSETNGHSKDSRAFTTPHSNRTQKFCSNSANCTLNKEDIPPVTEMEHLVSQCFCHLCDCGEHLCPADTKGLTQFTSSQFSTSYKLNFRNHKSPEPSKPNLVKDVKQYRPNNFKFDSLTTQRESYQAFQVQPPQYPKTEEKKPYPYIMGRSSYQAEFMNWGPNQTHRVKTFHPPYRKSLMKTEMKTSYSNNFLKTEGFKNTALEEGRRIMRSFTKTEGFLSPAKDFFGQSQARQDFKGFKVDHIPKREKVIQKGHLSSPSLEKHFSTTYRQSFLNGNNTKRIPRKKQALN